MKYVFFLVWFFASIVNAGDIAYQSGDLIFQSSSSKQSYAIMWASKSLYSHVGIIEVDGDKIYVLEAISRVSRTPLNEWIARGRFGRYSVFRYKNLDSDKRVEIVNNAKDLLGRRYDLYFTSKNKEIYCSELVDIAFGKAGVSVGKKQKVKELDINNLVVRKLVERRWRRHPVCKDVVKTFEECWRLMLEDELITPESLAEDVHLEKVWSNYP
ncbi:YiiX/YebB-like N1pC/P60 family cysteine hydrolase [Bdellovibrio sp. KM01]|uniref:YiiX/YebB-like N1pC/P60 family cysteine hydrolase n=1 Tax=Bdellovibrio sp. KM01 TaxID=2748865 RepID=UPI0015E9FF3D|nr:YiiX/YebB-like N1pC/P60 family cysteine hydrolase [Bdellovibrio sp. KM01]QLY26433.1 peptidoglycan peptidase [Bdellovibrio sp. KM01]